MSVPVTTALLIGAICLGAQLSNTSAVGIAVGGLGVAVGGLGVAVGGTGVHVGVGVLCRNTGLPLFSYTPVDAFFIQHFALLHK